MRLLRTGSNITIRGIPNTYRHLEVRIEVRVPTERAISQPSEGVPDMADLTTAQRAALLIGGVHVNADTPVASADEGIADLIDVAGKMYVAGVSAGSTTLTAAYGGRSGSLDVSVSSEPLVLTLGTPEPK